TLRKSTNAKRVALPVVHQDGRLTTALVRRDGRRLWATFEIFNKSHRTRRSPLVAEKLIRLVDLLNPGANARHDTTARHVNTTDGNVQFASNIGNRSLQNGRLPKGAPGGLPKLTPDFLGRPVNQLKLVSPLVDRLR